MFFSKQEIKLNYEFLYYICICIPTQFLILNVGHLQRKIKIKISVQREFCLPRAVSLVEGDGGKIGDGTRSSVQSLQVLCFCCCLVQYLPNVVEARKNEHSLLCFLLLPLLVLRRPTKTLCSSVQASTMPPSIVTLWTSVLSILLVVCAGWGTGYDTLSVNLDN